MFQRRYSLNNMTIQILIVVLGEVQEIGWTVVVDSHVDARQLIQTHVVVAYGADYRHEVAQGSC